MKVNEQIQIRNAIVIPGSVSDEDRTVDFEITSEEVDTYKSVFRASGWDFTDYNANPVVAYNHRAGGDDPDNIIATTIKIWQEGTKTFARAQFEEAEINPKAEKVFRKVKSGTLRMASINAYIDEASMGRSEEGEDPEVIYFTKQRLREWSVVDFGSNPTAFARNNEQLQALRSAVKEENTGNEDPPTDNGEPETVKKRALTRFEAQLIVNKNRLK